MNLELIRKYEKEFLHMLHGGNILVKCTDKLNVSHKDYLDWHCDSDVFESNLDYLIVIDDIYCTYRIALSEGKTVQCNAREGENDISYTAYGHLWWIDTTEFKYATCFYRIKPEEPEFKIGDYVRYIHANSPKTITNCKY